MSHSSHKGHVKSEIPGLIPGWVHVSFYLYYLLTALNSNIYLIPVVYAPFLRSSTHCEGGTYYIHMGPSHYGQHVMGCWIVHRSLSYLMSVYPYKLPWLNGYGAGLVNQSFRVWCMKWLNTLWKWLSNICHQPEETGQWFWDQNLL